MKDALLLWRTVFSLFWLFWGIGTLIAITRLIRYFSQLSEAFLMYSFPEMSQESQEYEFYDENGSDLTPGVIRYDLSERAYADDLREKRDRIARVNPNELEDE